ncbi:hypothetical protein [Streptacidiphilus sp. MAP5-3]|uniref:hypothetical protein n=1 Tax=unclassified Streptacidiphilus TaxID=2643834 RepID=UPI0035157878
MAPASGGEMGGEAGAAAGGEEKALFAALRDDVHQALPKIAEQHAHVVEDAADKGSRNLADHAANEAQIAEDFRSRMPTDEPRTPLSTLGGVSGPEGPGQPGALRQPQTLTTALTTPGGTAVTTPEVPDAAPETASETASAAASASPIGTAESTMTPESAIHGTRIERALGQDDATGDGTGDTAGGGTGYATGDPTGGGTGGVTSGGTGDATAAADLSTPQFGSAALRDSPNFDDQIDQALEGTGLSREEYDGLRLTPTHELTVEQIQQVAGVRNAIGIQDGQIVTKVVDREVADGYLANDHELFGGNFDPTTFGNSIARGTDIADLATPAQLRDGLSLDDRGHGWTPVAEDAEEAYQLRFPAPKGLGASAEPSYGAVGDAEADPSLQDRADSVARIATGRRGARGSVMEDPFTGTGYTAAGVPEWLLPRGTPLPRRAEMWKMTRDGRETMVGYYNQGVWTRVDDPRADDPRSDGGARADDGAGADGVRVDDVDG